MIITGYLSTLEIFDPGDDATRLIPSPNRVAKWISVSSRRNSSRGFDLNLNNKDNSHFVAKTIMMTNQKTVFVSFPILLMWRIVVKGEGKDDLTRWSAVSDHRPVDCQHITSRFAVNIWRSKKYKHKTLDEQTVETRDEWRYTKQSYRTKIQKATNWRLSSTGM